MASDTLGELLTRMVRNLAAEHVWTMTRTHGYLGQQVGASSDVLYKWRRNSHDVRPPNDIQLERLVTIGVMEAGMDRKWAEDVLNKGRHPDREAILRRLFGESAVRHNLPNSANLILGREAEMDQIRERLAPDSRHFIVPIEGIGGIGKTALALEIARYYVERHDFLPKSCRYEAIIWASAKRTKLMTRGVERIEPSLTTLTDVYRAIAPVLEAPRILHAPAEKQRGEARDALKAAGRVLLVLDNLEAIDDPELLAILAFLDDLPAPAKALVTTREHEDLPRPLHLGVLEESAASQLVQRECGDRDIQITDQQVDALLRATGRVPLALWLAIGLMSMQGVTVDAVLEQLAAQDGDLCQFIYHEAVESLKARHADAYHVLLALSFFDPETGATLPALAATAGLEEDACRGAVQRLVNLNLVNRMEQGSRLGMLPLTRGYVLAELEKDPDWEEEARGRWVEAYLELAQQNGGQDWANWAERYYLLRVEWPNVLNALTWCAEHGWYEAVKTFWDWDHVRDFADIRGVDGCWGDRIYWFGWLAQEAERRGESERSAMVDAMSSEAWPRILRGSKADLERAWELLKAAWDLRDAASPAIQADVANQYAILCIRKEEYADALDLIAKQAALLGYLPEAGHVRARQGIQVIYYRGQVCFELGQYTLAKEHFLQVVTEGEAMGWQRAINYAENWLADIAIKMGELADAERLIRSGLPVAEHNRDARRTALYKRSYAHLEHARGHSSEGRRWAEQALDLFERLGMDQEAKEMRQLVTPVPAVQQDRTS